MIGLPAGTRIWIVAGSDGYAAGIHRLERDVADGGERESVVGSCVCVSREARRWSGIKLLWWDGDGLCLFAKRLERGGRFTWPQAANGTVSLLTPAQLSMLLEGIDWRRPVAQLRSADGGVSKMVLFSCGF